MTIPTFSDTVVRQLANVLESAASHREFTSLFNECKIAEQGGTPKWERITLALTFRQCQDGCGNNVVVFIQAVMNPVRFVGQTSRFQEFRNRLNEVISFVGFQLGDDGTIRVATVARTLSEAASALGGCESFWNKGRFIRTSSRSAEKNY